MRGCSISFSDPHFGDCPIVQAEGYWNFMLCYLKKVRGGGRPMPATDPIIMTITCPFQTYSMGSHHLWERHHRFCRLTACGFSSSLSPSLCRCGAWTGCR